MRFEIFIGSAIFLLTAASVSFANDERTTTLQAELVRALSENGTSPGHAVLLPTAVEAIDHLGSRILRFRVTLDGYPVFFQRGAVRVSQGGAAVRVFNPIDNLVAPVSNEFFPEDETVRSWMRRRGIEVVPPFTSGYFAFPSYALSPAVRVESAVWNDDAQIYYLDAKSGKIMFQEPLFQSAKAVPSLRSEGTPVDASIWGSVYLENPRITPDTRLVSIPNLDDGALHLYGKYARVETCTDVEECKETAPSAMRSNLPGEEFVFTPTKAVDEDDPFAEVNAYYNIDSASAWVHETFGWNKLFGGETWIMVKVGRYWDNAAYYAGSDKQAPYIVFGKTEEINFAYDADTARHEFGHAVNDLFWDHPWSRTDSLGLDISMNALEEALADMWALTYTGDSMLNGEPGYSRNAANTYVCPGNMVGEGHLDARFVDGFAWDLRAALGKEAFENVLYRTLSFLDNETGYPGFVRALERSAAELAEEGAAGVKISAVDDIRKIGEKRGLLDPACKDRIVPLLDRTPRLAVGYGTSRTRKMDYPFPLQWKVTFEENAQSASLDFTWIYPETDDAGEPLSPGYRVHVRRGKPVEIRWLDADSAVEGEPAYIATADHTVEDSPKFIRFPLDGEPPVSQGESFYILPAADIVESVIALQAGLALSTAAAVAPLEDDTEAPIPETNFTAADGAPSCNVTMPAGPSSGSFFDLLVDVFF